MDTTAGRDLNGGWSWRTVDRKLEETRVRLPADLVVARTSDQPRQVAENIDLFMTSLYEAIVLVVIVAFLGFWEWRSAALMMLAIPTTLAMTFGMMYVLGVELQQVSVGHPDHRARAARRRPGGRR
jgi:multidrug efflux pump subunit AcrB